MEVPSMEDVQRQQQQVRHRSAEATNLPCRSLFFLLCLQEAMMQERRAVILEQILEPAAKDRIQRLGLVKPDKAKRIEDSLISAATSGQLKTKVGPCLSQSLVFLSLSYLSIFPSLYLSNSATLSVSVSVCLSPNRRRCPRSS
jgi:DNA-binding TFAR19-related protein (PDSD5 family)